MKSDRLQSAYRSGLTVVYLRVSTKKQQRSEFKSQSLAIKRAIPELRITAPTTTQLKEVMSGKADKEIRIGGKLGTAIRLMMRNPDMTMFVSHYDRIARTVEIFEMIKAQGLGHRIYSVNCGKNLDEMMADGDHHRIVARTKAHDRRCQRGRERYLADGGTLGNRDIARHSPKGAKTQEDKARRTFETVLSTLKDHVHQYRGKEPTRQSLCDELNEAGIRTGQGRLFTPIRLVQMIKGKRSQWDYAKDSYSRPRRRVRRLVQLAGIQSRLLRIMRAKRALLSSFVVTPPRADDRQVRSSVLWSPTFHVPTWNMNCLGGPDRCRGPPYSMCLLFRHCLANDAQRPPLNVCTGCYQPSGHVTKGHDTNWLFDLCILRSDRCDRPLGVRISYSTTQFTSPKTLATLIGHVRTSMM